MIRKSIWYLYHSLYLTGTEHRERKGNELSSPKVLRRVLWGLIPWLTAVPGLWSYFQHSASQAQGQTLAGGVDSLFSLYWHRRARACLFPQCQCQHILEVIHFCRLHHNQPQHPHIMHHCQTPRLFDILVLVRSLEIKSHLIAKFRARTPCLRNWTMRGTICVC